MYRKRYYKKRKYNDEDNMSPIEMFFEMIFMLAELIVRLIIKIISFGYKKLFSVNVPNMNIDESVNIHTGEEDEVAARLRRKIMALPPIEEKEEQKYDLQPSLLTPTEEIFYGILKEAVGESYQIIPQVQLSKIMKVRDSNFKYTNYHDFNQINKKSIDFVLYDQSLRVYLAIELDDYTHSRPDRIKRDSFVEKIMKEAGLRLLRVPVSGHYDIVKLRSEIFQ